MVIELELEITLTEVK